MDRPDTGNVDHSKLPDRLPFEADLTPAGYVWISSAVMYGPWDELPADDDLHRLYATQDGDLIAGYLSTDGTNSVFDASMNLIEQRSVPLPTILKTEPPR